MNQITTQRIPGRWTENLTHREEDILSHSLIQVLIKRFNEDGVFYCHWKSNIDLVKSFEGELDTDLLVSNISFARATNILMELDFKSATSRWTQNPTGIFHFYGYDPNQKELAHLHMFTRVLTGESFLKSHLLPFEEMLLEDTRFVNEMAVTSKESELVLFVLRMCISERLAGYVVPYGISSTFWEKEPQSK